MSSYIGTLDQIGLADVLQRLEGHAMTGMLVVRQEALWVELYFRQGRLLCIGPLRDNRTLAERLLQAGVISREALQNVMLAISGFEPSETRIAISLMEMGYVTRDELRTWASREAANVLKVLLTWRAGEMYFDEDRQPPSERLLVALSVSSLLPASTSQVQPSVPSAPSQPAFNAQPSAPSFAPPPDTEGVRRTGALFDAPASGQLRADSLFDADALAHLTGRPAAPAEPAPAPGQGQLRVDALFDADALAAVNAATAASPEPQQAPAPSLIPETPQALPPPKPVTVPVAPPRIDVSFMKPDMVLQPADLSAYRGRNIEVQMTPDQWRVFTCIDGRMTLHAASQRLMMSPQRVCQLAGELIALGLVQHPLAPPPLAPVQELSPVARDLMTAGMANGYVMPGFAASGAQPWAGSLPVTGAIPPVAPTPIIPMPGTSTLQSSTPVQPAPQPPATTRSLFIETESQWGNGGNGATFVVGRGWGVPSQPLQQPQQPSDPAYASAGGGFPF